MPEAVGAAPRVKLRAAVFALHAPARLPADRQVVDVTATGGLYFHGGFRDHSTMPMITLLSGTNRPGSNTRKVTARIEAAYRDLGVPTRTIDLLDLPPELFSPAAYAVKPPSFAPFAQAVLDATGLVVVTPEYNGAAPGVLKLFIDHLKFPESFEGRPVCFVGLAAGAWGALRSVEQLQQVFAYRNAFLFPQRVFIPGVGGALDSEGRFVDPELDQRLRRQAAGFAAFVQAVGPKPAA